MENNFILQKRNKMFVKIIWIMVALGVLTDLMIGVETSILLTLLVIGGVCCTVATYMTYAQKGTLYVMYVIPTISSLLTFLLIYHDPDPLISTYLLLYVNIGLMTLYANYKPIIYAGVLAMGITTYFFEVPFYHDKLFEGEMLSYLLLFLAFITAALAFAARFSEKLQRTVLEKQKDTEEARMQSESLLNELQSSIQILNRLSTQLRDNVNVTSSISKEVTLTFGGVTGTMERQSQSMQDMTQSVHSLNTMVEQTTEGSAELLRISEETLASTSAAGERMSSLSQQITQIQHMTTLTVEVMEDLNKKNQQIGQMVQTIQHISSQTNLLAMNAAIEAAHAGEHGKGFAVVAGEIRKLAEDSRRSTAEIDQILNDTMNKIGQAAEQIQLGHQAIHNSEEETQEVQKLVEAVSRNAVHVHEQSGLMNSSVYQIHESHARITAEILTLAEGTQQNMGAVEEILAGIETQDSKINEIVNHYEELNDLIVKLSNKKSEMGSAESADPSKPHQDSAWTEQHENPPILM
ncbi:chemotaxis protein [Paenibacillus sp. CAA11]|uniref:methyl-accepting chemotaxis protein n=1 Tax=Paenibacillus sp. CAA11 TaxID=1532905 RepID=UPI000D3433D3|nr:methyl-accepting chemotaxis protein [Paenibacillus sp. CAA11]AWB42944.1 chemotaxis protein [Paenibacillus sp. CAA11]